MKCPETQYNDPEPVSLDPDSSSLITKALHHLPCHEKREQEMFAFKELVNKLLGPLVN